VTDLDVVTGELVSARMTPTEVVGWGNWVREIMRSALAEGVDYGTIPGTGSKPTMFKSGAEMLLKAAGLGFSMERLDDDDYAREAGGVTYRCTVVRADGAVVAQCDGYCGRDEPAKRAALRNTIVKIAQKRALVGAALNATASSGLFVADVDDDPPPAAAADDPEVTGDERATLRRAITALPDTSARWLLGVAKADQIPNIDGARFRRSHRDRLAWHTLVAQAVTAAPEPVDEATPEDVYNDAPESAPGRYEEEVQ